MGEIRITQGYDIREVIDNADGPVVWAGRGAEAMGLTGVAAEEDLLRVFSKDEEPSSFPEADAAIARLRRDGLL
jgi:hypothetical protein